MDRRHAAQRRAAQVERPGRVVGDRRHERHGRVADVGDQPQPVAAVQLAGLRRDVGRRVVQPEEGVEVVALALGDDLAVPVGVEPVDHHPVEAGQRADPAGRGVGDVEHAAARLQRHRRLPHDHRVRRVVDLVALDLDHEVGAATGRAWRSAARPSCDRDLVEPLHPVHGPDPLDGRPAGRADELPRGGAPTASAGDMPNQPPTLAETTATTSSGSVTAISTPWGWIAPGTWIGSLAQLSRSTGADQVPVIGPAPRRSGRTRRRRPVRPRPDRRRVTSSRSITRRHEPSAAARRRRTTRRSRRGVSGRARPGRAGR